MSANAPTKDPRVDFAVEHDVPIPYMQRTRRYYLGLGYDNPYRWAHYADVPFAALGQPLAQCRLAIVTTASPYPQPPGGSGADAKFFEVFSLPLDPPPELVITHVAYDRNHADLSDPRAWFPGGALAGLAESGVIGGVAGRVHGMPTNRSQATTINRDCPALLERLREDGADAALLVPICPVCHQTLSLAARHLEQHGVPSVVMGCAKDIVEHVGVPRFLFSDFPLGQPAGRPHDKESQQLTAQWAVRLLADAPGPRTTMQSPLRWSENPDWKLDYSNIDRLSPEQRTRLRQEFDHYKAVGKQKKRQAGLVR